MWRRRINPAIGNLKISDVTDEDAGAVVRAPLRLDATARVIGGKAEAGNTYRLLHHMFSKALGWGLRAKEAGNPLENVSEPKVPRRGHCQVGSPAAPWQVAGHDDIAEPVSGLSLPAGGHPACRVALSLLHSEPA